MLNEFIKENNNTVIKIIFLFIFINTNIKIIINICYLGSKVKWIIIELISYSLISFIFSTFNKIIIKLIITLN